MWVYVGWRVISGKCGTRASGEVAWGRVWRPKQSVGKDVRQMKLGQQLGRTRAAVR